MKRQYTPQELIDELPNIGPWSAYYLAEIALIHYFPEIKPKSEHDYIDVMILVEKLHELGCNYWHDVIKKYQEEVGYSPKGGVFCSSLVNEN